MNISGAYKIANNHVQCAENVFNKLFFYHFAIVVLEKRGLYLLNLVKRIVLILNILIQALDSLLSLLDWNDRYLFLSYYCI